MIEIQDHFDEKWKDWFEGMENNYEGDNTIITANLKDEAQRSGILNKIRDCCEPNFYMGQFLNNHSKLSILIIFV